jgi:hypothetical protein
MAEVHDELRSRFQLLPTEELTAILRARDRDVWRPEVFDIVKAVLVSRGVFSVNPEPPRADAAEAGSDMVTVPEGWQSVASALDLGEADDADKVLGAAGVPVQVIQDGAYGYSIYVPLEYAESGWQELRAAGIIPSEDPPEAITLTGGSCPGCGESVPAEAGECPACGLAV